MMSGRDREYAAKQECLRAVIYARVSSKEQDKEGFSIPAQLKLLKSYAAKEGVHIAKEFVDVETAKSPIQNYCFADHALASRLEMMRIEAM